MPLIVTLPRFESSKVYAIWLPTTGVPPASAPVLTSCSTGAAATVTRAVSVARTGAPVGGVPATVAVLSTRPRSTSACVSVYVAVPVML